MRMKAGFLTAIAFLLAAGISFVMALALGTALESRSQRHVQRALVNAGLTWASASADGLLVTLGGTAPSEAIRLRAGTVASRVVGSSRIIDEMGVTPSKPLTAPRFSLELLRNDDGVSVIGLAPTSWDPAAFQSAAKLLADEDLTYMVETADFEIPTAWDEAITFGLSALRLLPRSKISIAADGVRVNAIADSPDQKFSFETQLARNVPQNVPINVQISAPRAVIAPFTLRFVVENGAARFDACSADTERARMRIIAAGRRAGVPGTPACVLGLGTPSPRWAEGAEALIRAVADLGAGSVSISDVDVTLIAEHGVPQSDFDRVIGELTTKLPEVFSLKATLTPAPQTGGLPGPAQFTAQLSPEGRLELRGRLRDDRMRDTVEAYARARFGAANVYVATRLDEQLPPNWGIRVLAGLQALAEVSHGAALVEPEMLALRGVTGNAGASAEVSRLLSDRLGQGQRYSVEVRYDERLDPDRGLPSPDQCLARSTELLDSRQIKFAPNSAEITREAAHVISSLAEILEECAGARLEIGGHTDSQGRAESNQALSQRRAEAVLEGLLQRGIDTAMMSAKGYGAAEPIAENTTEAGRDANRRIALKLLVDPTAQKVTDVVSPEDPEDDGEAISSIRPPSRPEALGGSPATPPPAAEDGDAAADTETGAAAPEEAEATEPAPDDIPELPEGDEPMGEAGDLEIGPDGEPIGDMPLDDLPAEPEPEAPAEGTPADGAEATAVETAPEVDTATDAAPAEAATTAGAPQDAAAVDAPAAPPAPDAESGAPAAEAEGAEAWAGANAAPAAPPGDAPALPAITDGPAADRALGGLPTALAPATDGPAAASPDAADPGPEASAPEAAPQTDDDPALPTINDGPAALRNLRPPPKPFAPLPEGWEPATDLPQLRPLPRPKEIAP